MRLLLLLSNIYFFINSSPIIKNSNIPSCKNCIYYKPSLFSDFTSFSGKCEKIGEKNIITDEIIFEYAKVCREDNKLCGKEGKHFKLEKNIKMKMLKHFLLLNANILILSYVVLTFVIFLIYK
jgi:hypothetical protein